MTLTFYLFIALAGAALFGFVSAWFWQKQQLEKCEVEVNEVKSKLQEESLTRERLQMENETQKLSIENMQKLMQNLENQCFGLEQEVRKANNEAEMFRNEKHRLLAELDTLMRENEAIREMPEIDFDLEIPEEEEAVAEETDFRTKAKKLVRAFRKGYQDVGAPPSNS